MTDWLEEEEKAENTNNFNDRMQDVLIVAGVIPTSPSDKHVPSPKTILQMKELTDNFQHLHITTPKTPKKSDTNQIIDTPLPSPEMPQLPIFHLLPPPEMPQNRPPPPRPYLLECHLLRKRQRHYSDCYKRKLKVDCIKEKFPKFLDSFSDKEWEEGIPTQTFRF
ncbi:hypothetical protein M9Y10_033207 [Tritrichomonas musculus]|uniref:Uncharacterized protein n=1 Tax=Tritrichomonas musculus TaxID=1915356 RepID=A0ABR2GXB9_9EUKA